MYCRFLFLISFHSSYVKQCKGWWKMKPESTCWGLVSHDVVNSCQLFFLPINRSWQSIVFQKVTLKVDPHTWKYDPIPTHFLTFKFNPLGHILILWLGLCKLNQRIMYDYWSLFNCLLHEGTQEKLPNTLHTFINLNSDWLQEQIDIIIDHLGNE